MANRLDLPPVFETMNSIVIAEFDSHGELLRCNTGFRHLVPSQLGLAWLLFTQPRLAELASRTPDAEGKVHEGLITLGDPEGKMQTLRGAVYLENGHLQLIAGYDIEEFESMQARLLEINNELEAAHRDQARSARELARREETIRQLSLTDPLTGVGNRRQLDEILAAETDRAHRYGSPLSVVFLDIDHFKNVNDTCGHEAGDRVLAETGALLRGMLRQSDCAARFGGEEFVVLMPGLQLQEAMKGAERMRMALQQQAIDNVPKVTASFGVASLLADETAAALLKRADEALYQAKQAGRNRVVADPST